MPLFAHIYTLPLYRHVLPLSPGLVWSAGLGKTPEFQSKTGYPGPSRGWRRGAFKSPRSWQEGCFAFAGRKRAQRLTGKGRPLLERSGLPSY